MPLGPCREHVSDNELFLRVSKAISVLSPHTDATDGVRHSLSYCEADTGQRALLLQWSLGGQDKGSHPPRAVSPHHWLTAAALSTSFLHPLMAVGVLETPG